METISRALLTFFVNAVWQVPLIAGAVWAACRWMRTAPARQTHTICVVGLLAALALPLIPARRAAEPPTIAIPQPTAYGAERTVSTGAPSSIPAPASRTVEVPRVAVSIAVWAFAAFLLARLGLLALAAFKTLRICRAAEPAAASCPAFDRARAAFAVDRVELRWSSRVSGPVTAGRMIILPASMGDADEAVLATAIGHEMAHIARHDFGWNLLYEALALPISFHPAAGWLRRQIDRTREMACDEMVTTRLVDSRSYAQSILSIASTMAAVARPGYTLGVFDGDILEERIRRLVRRPAAYTRRARALAGAAVAAMAVCVVAASMLAVSARAQGPAQQEMRAAGDAYNAEDYAGAVAHFEKAVAIDPSNTKARLFLANTYLRLGSGFDEKARAQALEAIRIDPKSKAAYYTLGFVDWRIAYPRLSKAQPTGGIHLYDWVADDTLRSQLQRDLLPYIDEGYRALQAAVGLDPQWSDAMAYLNLTARLHAAIAQDADASRRDIAEADAWVGKALAAIKARPTGRPAADRIDVDGPVPTYLLAPPPPPPPAPPGVPRGEKQR